MAFLAALLLLLGSARAEDAAACPPLPAPPAHMQVAWVSPVRKRVRGGSTLSVVRVAELRTFDQAQGPDRVRALQALGIVGPRGKLRRRYKVTLFDVSAQQLCRPVEHTLEGEDADGLPACPGGRASGIRRDTGCGTSLDTALDGPGLQVYQLQWREAARNGFCVMPLERFLAGA